MNKKIIHTVFEQKAAQFPTRIAIEESSREITYQELNQTANCLAQALQVLGVELGSRVGVLLPSGIDLVTALLATFKAGGVYVPVDLAFPTQKLQHILRQCQPQVLITSETSVAAVLQLLDSASIPYTYLLALQANGTQRVYTNPAVSMPAMPDFLVDLATNLPLVSHPDDGNYIFYTSGSTGEPKAILGCHKSLGHFIDWEITEFGTTETCRVSQLTQVTFDASLRDIFVPLCTGGTLVIPSVEVRSNVWKLIEWLDEKAITQVHYVPSLFRLITRELSQHPLPKPVFAHLTHFLLAGEMLYVKDIQQWRETVGTHVQLVNLYGPTETTMIKTFYRIGDVATDPAQALPAGKPLTHTLIAVVNDGLACQPGEIGEVYIKTPFMTKGYPFDAALQANAFVQNPLTQDPTDIVYKTGDLGRMLPSGDLEILGRADTQIKLNGVRVEIGEIEKAFRAMPQVDEVVVIPYTDESQHTTLLAYYTGTAQTEETIRTFLQEYLALVAIPSYMIHLDEMPLTLNGKVDKKALPKPQQVLLSDAPYDAPVGATEQQLEAIWKDVLELPRISRTASFFAIGGTSLKAIKVISRMYKELGILLKVGDLFTYPDLEQLALRVAETRRKTRTDLVAIPDQDYYELSHAQKRLWILEQTETEQTAYNMPGVYEWEGSLDTEAFRKALHTVVERHEVLRTTFVTIEGYPKQKVHSADTFAYTLELQDIRHATDPESVWHQLADQQLSQPFDLATGPLFRTSLIQTEPQRFIFVFNMHHIISDAWTLDLLTYEVLTLYRAYQSGQPQALPNLPVQFRDYAHWESQQLQGENLEKLRQFWQQQFAESVPVLNLPTDYPRPERMSFHGKKITLETDTAQTAAIHKCIREQGVTQFMFLFGTVSVLLYRYSNQKDMVIGIPVANRDHLYLEHQAGFYISTLPVRTTFESQLPFTDFLRRIKTNLLNLYEHALYPVDKLVEDLNLSKDMTRNNLFDVMVQVQDTKSVVQAIAIDEDLRVQKLSWHEQTSKFDLTFNFEEEAGKIQSTIEFNTSLYTQATIEHMLKDLAYLWKAVTDNPFLSISTLRNQLLAQTETETIDQQVSFADTEINAEY